MGEGLSITIKSVTVLIGVLLFILGAVEIGVAITGAGGSFKRGVPVLVVGAVIAAVPLTLAFRDMMDAAREEGRLPPKESKRG